jgi:glycosyltransferase involved in cell wall biosynthesis
MLGISLGACDAHIVSLNAALEGFVVPSKFYGIAAAGRPIINIGAEDGEIARIVMDSGCGATFSPTDAAGLTRFLDSLAEDATLWSKSGERARKVFLDRFEKKRALEHWRAVIFSPQSNH